MGRTFLIAGWRVTEEDPGLQQALGAAHLARIRPRCLCRPEGVETYVAVAGDGFAVKRMPYSATKHQAWCAFAHSSEPASTVSRRRRVFADDHDFASFKARADALSAMLNDLWRAAELTRWQPAFHGRRSWSTVRSHLMSASRAFQWQGVGLAEQLYVPETFRSDMSTAIFERRTLRCREIMERDQATGTFIVVGEIKRITPQSNGYALIFKHVPDCSFELSDSRYGWINRLFAGAISLTGTEDNLHLVAAAIATLTSHHEPAVLFLSLMVTTPEWLPVRNAVERATLVTLVRDRRTFLVEEALASVRHTALRPQASRPLNSYLPQG